MGRRCSRTTKTPQRTLSLRWAECMTDRDHFSCSPETTNPPEQWPWFALVNGKAYPKLDAKRAEYRFRILNNCDTRSLYLIFRAVGNDQNGQPISQAVDVTVRVCCHSLSYIDVCCVRLRALDRRNGSGRHRHPVHHQGWLRPQDPELPRHNRLHCSEAALPSYRRGGTIRNRH